MGGREQPGSGSQPHAKSDFRKALAVRGECKHTSAKEFILKLEDLQKIRLEAVKGGIEAPVLQVEFLGQVGQSTKLAVIGWRWLADLWLSKPEGYVGMTINNVFQLGKQHILKLDEWRAFQGRAQAPAFNVLPIGLTPIYQVTFNGPDDKENPKNLTFAVLDWQVFLDLLEAEQCQSSAQ